MLLERGGLRHGSGQPLGAVVPVSQRGLPRFPELSQQFLCSWAWAEGPLRSALSQLLSAAVSGVRSRAQFPCCCRFLLFILIYF